jgi:hypothetical protein
MRFGWVRRATWLALLLVAPALLHAQGRPLTVNGQRDLAFGTLLPGVTTVVPPSDPSRSALFDVRGAKGTVLQVTFVLPPFLLGPGASLMPLAYGPASAAYSVTNSLSDLVTIDPALPLTVTLPTNGRLQIALGGTIRVPANQRAGGYAGIAIVIVADTGN